MFFCQKTLLFFHSALAIVQQKFMTISKVQHASVSQRVSLQERDRSATCSGLDEPTTKLQFLWKAKKNFATKIGSNQIDTKELRTAPVHRYKRQQLFQSLLDNNEDSSWVNAEH